MASWLARAKALFTQNSQAHTDETDKTGVSSVLAVRSDLILGNQGGLSSVSSVCSERICANDEIADPLVVALMAAAMRACDYWGDSTQARDQMRLEILEIKPEHRLEQLHMFNSEYPAGGKSHE